MQSGKSSLASSVLLVDRQPIAVLLLNLVGAGSLMPKSDGQTQYRRIRRVLTAFLRRKRRCRSGENQENPKSS
jgi:hypothetical protein